MGRTRGRVPARLVAVVVGVFITGTGCASGHPVQAVLVSAPQSEASSAASSVPSTPAESAPGSAAASGSATSVPSATPAPASSGIHDLAGSAGPTAATPGVVMTWDADGTTVQVRRGETVEFKLVFAQRGVAVPIAAAPSILAGPQDVQHLPGGGVIADFVATSVGVTDVTAHESDQPHCTSPCSEIGDLSFDVHIVVAD